MYSEQALRIAARLGWVQTLTAPLQVAEQLVFAVQESLPVTGVGLGWVKDEIPGPLIAATDERTRLLEDLQFALGEGPCTRSVATGRPVLVDDLVRSGRAWPTYTAAAVAAGVAAAFVIPLRVGHVTIGVLDLYCDTPGPLPADALTEALAFGTVGSWVLLHLTTNPTAHLEDGEVPEQQAERFHVHRAAQLMAAELSLPVKAALNILRARARAEERPLADLAQDVLAESANQ